jgi:hypothetical protein
MWISVANEDIRALLPAFRIQQANDKKKKAKIGYLMKGLTIKCRIPGFK